MAKWAAPRGCEEVGHSSEANEVVMHSPGLAEKLSRIWLVLADGIAAFHIAAAGETSDLC